VRHFWTKARVARLKRLWRAGKSAAAIGAELDGISRAAVLGKIFRLRAPGKGAAALKWKRAADAPDAPARRRAGKKPAQPARPAKPRRKTLFDLTNECCRWPYGELGQARFFFCGDAGADLARGIPCCPRHMRRAYIVPPTLITRPLHRALARTPATLSAEQDSSLRSLPRQRESGGRRFGSAA
jgi:GcrA cell cycle regulator